MVIRIIIFAILGDLYNSVPYSLQCVITSSIKSSKHVLNEFFSYFNTGKSDSTTTVPGKMVASSPLKAIKYGKWVLNDSHPSENLVWQWWPPNICLGVVSFDIALFKPLWSWEKVHCVWQLQLTLKIDCVL